MKFEALKPKATPKEPEVSETETLSEEGKQEKVDLIKKLGEQIKVVKANQAKLQEAVTLAETTNDWSPVTILRKELEKELASARRTKRRLEGGREDSTISASYKWTDETGKETVETIELDFETEISSMIAFYNKHKIELPADFAEQMQDIWQRNADSIKEAIEEKGFDKVLFLPKTLPNLADLEAKMTDGYEKEKGKKPSWEIAADQITEASRIGARIILVHKAPDLTAEWELKKTLGKEYGGEKENGKDNKAEDFIRNGETLTLSEYLILQRSVFEKTGVHLDGKKTPEEGVYWTWLPGSRGGSHVVYAGWDPGGGRLCACAVSEDRSYPDIGCRLSRCFQ